MPPSGADPGPPQSAAAGSSVVSITQLSTDHLVCRILIMAEQGELDIPGSEPIRAHRSGDGEGDGDGPTVQCLAVAQSHEDISCQIKSPFQCDLYYDPRADSVVAMANVESLIEITAMPAGGKSVGKQADEGSLLLRYRRREPITPGAWRFISSDGLRSLQLIVFPRRYSLSLVKLKALSTTAGIKREHPGDRAGRAGEVDGADEADEVDEARQEALEPVSTTEIIGRLGSLADLRGGQMVHLVDDAGVLEYGMHRMSLVVRTNSAQVFQARHSSYPNKVVVVKSFVHHDENNAMDRGKLWKSEFSIHRHLKSDTIVELFGADARLEALFMDNIDAQDLASKRWCDAKGDKRFLGARDHTERIISDMSRALLHLRQKKVLHNDIKPANILFSEQRGAVLIDFGLATLEGSPPSSGGTPWYVAPEYMEAARRAAPAEVWALGVVALYLLRHVPLPDSERQVKSWPIQNVVPGRRQPSAAGMMRKWRAIVDEIRRGLEYKGGFSRLVALMLSEDDRKRITVEEIILALGR